MYYLLLASFVWGFSFGLIGTELSSLPTGWVALVRLVFASLVFLPFLRPVSWRMGFQLMFIGALEFGIMYWCYLSAFSYLPSHEVALFTVFTPLYVVLIFALWNKRWGILPLCSAILAVLGGVLIYYRQGMASEQEMMGFWLVQISNICFALGQIWYVRVKKKEGIHEGEKSMFAYLYIGAVCVILPLGLWEMGTIRGGIISISWTQWGVMLYLGVIASGVCFFLWNKGARLVNSTQLAVMNNVKIPLAAFISLFFFNEVGDYSVIVGSLVLMLAAFALTLKDNSRLRG